MIFHFYFPNKQEQKAKAAASGSKSRGQDPAEKIDPVRQAAIEALKRKRAAGGGGGAATTAPAPAAVAAAAPKAADPSKPDKPASQIKLKFVIPKKNQPSSGAANPAKPPATAPPPKKPATATDGQPTAKRPAIKRTAPQLPGSQKQGDQPQIGQATTAIETTTAPPAQAPIGPGVPSIPRLFVGDLPEHFTSDTLFNFFSEFHHVEEAHVVSSFCYGFVTFGSYEDAQAVLDFQFQQPIQVEDRHLRISWARDTPNDTVRPREYGYNATGAMNGGGGDGGAPQEHPRIKAARLAAAEVLAQQDQHDLEDVHYSEAPGRNLVCYDDL